MVVSMFPSPPLSLQKSVCMQEEQESGAIIVVFTELESNDDLPHEVVVSKRCTITTDGYIFKTTFLSRHQTTCMSH